MQDPADTIVLDLDGTLTQDDRAVGYSDKAAAADVVAAAGAARRQGFRVVVATNRNMRTYAGDVRKIRQHTQPVIERWLRQHHVDVDGLVVGKTWCGPHGVYVDDRNLHVEEFTARFTGPFAQARLDIACWEPDAARQADRHYLVQRLRRWFHVSGLYYPGAAAATPAPVLRDDPQAHLIAAAPGRTWAGVTAPVHFLAACLARGQGDQVAWVQPSAATFDPAALVALHAPAFAALAGLRPVAMIEVHVDSARALLAQHAATRLLGGAALAGPARLVVAPRAALAAALAGLVAPYHLGSALAGRLRGSALSLPVPAAAGRPDRALRELFTYVRHAAGNKSCSR